MEIKVKGVVIRAGATPESGDITVELIRGAQTEVRIHFGSGQNLCTLRLQAIDFVAIGRLIEAPRVNLAR